MPFLCSDLRLPLGCGPAQQGSCADIAHARQSGLARLLDGGLALEVLADAGYQDLGAETGGRVVTPPHRKFKTLTPYPRRERHRAFEELANSDPHLGRREHISDTVQAVRRRPAVPPADDGPDFRHGRSEHRAQPPSSTPHRLPGTSSLGPAGPAFTPATPCNTPEGQSDIQNKKYPHLFHFALPGVSAHPNGQVADTWSHFESRGSFAFAQLKRMLVTLIPARHTSLRAAGTSRTP